MANQVIPILKGDDYQHLYSWYLALELKQPWRKVRYVTIEDTEAGSVDDVTIEYDPEANIPNRFYQIKYHIDQREQYSLDYLIDHSKDKSSLLAKFWRSWKLLKEAGRGDIRLYLVSNWTWDSSDEFFTDCVDENGAIKPIFHDKKKYAGIRSKWSSHLDTGTDDLCEFITSLRFQIGTLGADHLKEHVVERMHNLGLKSDGNALLIAAGIIREWIKSGRKIMSITDLDELVDQHVLLLPCEEEHFVTVHLNSIVREKYELEPDYVVDWCDYFEGSIAAKGRQLLAGYDWNKDLLPDLETLKKSIDSSTSTRLLRIQGKARLSPWFAVGYTFRDVAGYTLEVDQGGALWRTDAGMSEDLRLIIESNDGNAGGEIIDGTGSTVAVGISISGSLADDVRDHLKEQDEDVAALLLIRPERELGRVCIRDAGDLVALAYNAKEMVRHFVKRWRAKKLLLYYFGPLSGACFLGHQFNAVCQEIQLMEDMQPSYSPSFLLH